MATSLASGEKAAINLFLAIGSSSSPAHKQRLRMEVAAATMVSSEGGVVCACVSGGFGEYVVCVEGEGARWCLRKYRGN